MPFGGSIQLHGMVLPDRIKELVSGKGCRADTVGMSKARIFVFDDCVLKIEKACKKNDETIAMMRWLEGKLPAAKVICCERDETYQYLLMSRIPGKMSCDGCFLSRPKELADRLAEALRLLWQVDTSHCPRIRDLDAELQEARFRVENGLVDVDNAEPTTFGPGGFRDPEDLLQWLEANRPDYEPVLSHGDLCLPNIFIDGGRIGGFVDLGECGVGDRWRDIALCCRSLQRNAEGAYGGRAYPGIGPQMLFDALGMGPDPKKLRYYLLLDELF